MTTYAVFDRDAKDAPAVVADRFSWFAAILPPLFALAYGLWLEFFVYLVLVALLSASSVMIGDSAAFWSFVVLAVWIGFEAPAMRRGALRRRGWQHRTDVIAAADDQAMVEGLRGRAR